MSQPPFDSNPYLVTREPFHFDLPVPKPHHIEQFQSLYRERYGVELSGREAADKLTALLVIVRYRQHEEELNEFLQSKPNNHQPKR